MDPLDMRLLRAMFRGGTFQIGALDPRLSVASIAEKAAVPRSTAQGRLALWRETGFFARSDVWPNPALFGVGTGGVLLDVPDARLKSTVLREVRLVDGVLGAFDHVGSRLALQIIDDTPAGLERRLALLRRIPGVAKATVMGAWKVPRPPEPQPVHWQVIEALRAEPDAALSELAAKVGISTRTLTRHYTQLVEDRSVWFIPLLDYSKFPGVVARVDLELADAATKPQVLAEAARRAPELLIHTHEHGSPTRAPEPRVELFLHFENAAAVDEVVTRLAEIPGVNAVRTNFPLRITSFPEWFDERLATRGQERITRPKTRAPTEDR